MLRWVRAYYHWNRNEAKMSIYLLSPKTHLLTKPEPRRILNSVVNSQSKVEMFCTVSSQFKSHNTPSFCPGTISLACSCCGLASQDAPNLWGSAQCSCVPVISATILWSYTGHICIYRRNWSPERLRDFPKVTMSLKPKEQEAMTGKGWILEWLGEECRMNITKYNICTYKML